MPLPHRTATLFQVGEDNQTAPEELKVRPWDMRSFFTRGNDNLQPGGHNNKNLTSGIEYKVIFKYKNIIY